MQEVKKKWRSNSSVQGEQEKCGDYSSVLNIPVGAIFRNDIYWGSVVNEIHSRFVLHRGMLCSEI